MHVNYGHDSSLENRSKPNAEQVVVHSIYAVKVVSFPIFVTIHPSQWELFQLFYYAF